MTDRLLIKGGYVLTQDPALGELADADVLVEDDKIAAVGRDLPADGARVIDATRDIVIPGFIDTHRHTWETSIRTSAPDFALITYFGSILDKFAPHYRPDDVYAGNLWGSLECINAGHHDARRLVAHHEHAGPRRRGDPRAAGLEDPVRVRLRVREHLAPGLVVRPGLPGQRPDLGRARRPADPQAVLQLGRRPGHDGPRHARSQLLQAGRGPPRLGAGQGARPQHHRPRRDGPLRLHQDAGDDAPGHGPAVPEHDVRPRVAFHRRRNGRWRATRAATCRSPRRSRSRWATAGRPP